MASLMAFVVPCGDDQLQELLQDRPQYPDGINVTNSSNEATTPVQPRLAEFSKFLPSELPSVLDSVLDSPVIYLHDQPAEYFLRFINMPFKHPDSLLSVASIKAGSEGRRMSSTLRQSVTARRVSQGGSVTTLFEEQIATEKAITSRISNASVCAETSRRPSAVKANPISRNRRSSRSLHEIQVQPRPTQRSLSQHQLLLLTPFGSSIPLVSPSAPLPTPTAPSTLGHAFSTNPESTRSVTLTRGPATRSESPSTTKLGSILQPQAVGSLLSVDMSRSTSMPAFTSREVEANAAKDADLGLSRGDSFVWMDDNSRNSDQQEDFALITPPEPQASSSGGFAVAQAEFFGNNWQQDRPLFANPFDNMIRSKPAPRDEISQAPHETSPGGYNVPELRLPHEANDPPSPTRRRPSLPRYRSSPELHHISSDAMNDSSRAGLNIVFSTSDGSLGDAWTRPAAGPSSSTDSALRSPPPMQGCAILMRRSIEDTEQTLVNLLPRLSTNSQSFGAGMKRPSLTYGDPSDGPATEMKRQSLTSRRGSWAQASFIDFSPPPITLGREYRSRFNSVDSAMTRNSDAGSLFGSFSGSDWMKPYDTKKEEWARRSADFSSIGIRRGSDTNARRRSSLMRTAYVNSSLNRLGSMNVSSAAPSETQFYDPTYRETANPGPTRGFRFGSAISNLSGIVSPEKTVREEDEGAEGQEWQTRRGSWCEV